MQSLISTISKISTTVAVASGILITGTAVVLAVALGPPHFAEKVKVPGVVAGAKHTDMVNNSAGPGGAMQASTSSDEGGSESMKANNAAGQSVETRVEASADQGKLSVKVNGQNINLDGKKHVQKVITSPDGQTNVEVNVSGDHQGSVSNSSSSSLSLQVDSTSTSAGG